MWLVPFEMDVEKLPIIVVLFHHVLPFSCFLVVSSLLGELEIKRLILQFLISNASKIDLCS